MLACSLVPNSETANDTGILELFLLPTLGGEKNLASWMCFKKKKQLLILCALFLCHHSVCILRSYCFFSDLLFSRNRACFFSKLRLGGVQGSPRELNKVWAKLSLSHRTFYFLGLIHGPDQFSIINHTFEVQFVLLIT